MELCFDPLNLWAKTIPPPEAIKYACIVYISGYVIENAVINSFKFDFILHPGIQQDH